MATPGKDPDYQPETVAGKRTNIFGGAKGIGLATAELFASKGATVFVFGRHEDDLSKALDR